jgi:hypothetical protein
VDASEAIVQFLMYPPCGYDIESPFLLFADVIDDSVENLRVPSYAENLLFIGWPADRRRLTKC